MGIELCNLVPVELHAPAMIVSMSSNNDNVIIQIAVYRRDQNNHDRLKSRQKSFRSIYIYVLIVLSLYTYT
jgi:hypothetical protein